MAARSFFIFVKFLFRDAQSVMRDFKKVWSVTQFYWDCQLEVATLHRWQWPTRENAPFGTLWQVQQKTFAKKPLEIALVRGPVFFKASLAVQLSSYFAAWMDPRLKFSCDNRDDKWLSPPSNCLKILLSLTGTELHFYNLQIINRSRSRN